MKLAKIVAFLCFMILASGSIYATSFFINFENGTDGFPVNNIPGFSFLTLNNLTAVYGDSRTLNYDTHSDDLNYGSGGYHHNGNFFLWSGRQAQGTGVKVDFVNNNGTSFKTGYSYYSADPSSTFKVDAYFTDSTIASVSGNANFGSPMSFLEIIAPTGKFIDYVVLHDTGNLWIADDMSGNTLETTPSPVPEPSTLLLLGFGLSATAVALRRWKR